MFAIIALNAILATIVFIAVLAPLGRSIRSAETTSNGTAVNLGRRSAALAYA
jgi:hypothetical protein